MSASNASAGTHSESALKSWSIGLSAVGTNWDTQYGVLKYGSALESAGAYGDALYYLSKATGISEAGISLYQLVNHPNLGNGLRFAIDLTFAFGEVDPAILVTKGILDATGTSDTFYNGISNLGNYFTTYGYTYSPNRRGMY